MPLPRSFAVALGACLLSTLLQPATTGEAGSRLVLVYAVNRHGARNALPKGSSLQDAPVRPRGEVTLLPLVRVRHDVFGARPCTVHAQFTRGTTNVRNV